MDQLAGDLLNDSDSDDQDYVPSEGEGDEVPEEVNSDPEQDSDDEHQKKRTDALWADFMSDAEPIPKKPKVEAKPDPSTGKDEPELSAGEDKPETKNIEGPVEHKDATREGSAAKDETPGTSSSGKVKITQVFDFAGEKIEVEKEVEKGSKEEKKHLAEQEKQKQASDNQTVLVRPKAGGGLSTVVGSILNKKNKMSVLEKSKLDWSGFKRQEGIEEELATFNRGKGGYLEKMAFLERADLRQFDIEKALREKKRNR